VIRVEYEHQLQELKDDVVAMGSMVDKAIARATQALLRQDVQTAREVIATDPTINQHRWQTEEKALTIIATQAPMARDLRSIAAVLAIITELERMADHARGIARIVVDTAGEPLLKPLVRRRQGA
jgi:phosphate transport system protein